MDILWHRPGAAATHGNAVWLSNHLHTILPLVKAIEKRVTAWASLGMQNPWAQLTERELWELEALQLVRGTVEGNLARGAGADAFCSKVYGGFDAEVEKFREGGLRLDSDLHWHKSRAAQR